jgi:hypothetical protein
MRAPCGSPNATPIRRRPRIRDADRYQTRCLRKKRQGALPGQVGRRLHVPRRGVVVKTVLRTGINEGLVAHVARLQRRLESGPHRVDVGVVLGVVDQQRRLDVLDPRRLRRRAVVRRRRLQLVPQGRPPGSCWCRRPSRNPVTPSLPLDSLLALSQRAALSMSVRNLPWSSLACSVRPSSSLPRVAAPARTVRRVPAPGNPRPPGAAPHLRCRG